ncbi:MAG: hypothetical protein MZU97_24820 [Bacillus subtilis]|nr:hypothetical protein [Bacillus subtilis]
MIPFLHGSPSSPNRTSLPKEKPNDYIGNTYTLAFGVPVVYVNSVGNLDYMRGITGKLMQKSGFRLNGLSRIYSRDGVSISTTVPEANGIDVALCFKHRVADILFYGNDIVGGNVLFRRLILPFDIKKGIKFYEKNKSQASRR